MRGAASLINDTMSSLATAPDPLLPIPSATAMWLSARSKKQDGVIILLIQYDDAP
jgi:hypothetical protein